MTKPVVVREVWAHNLRDEFRLIRRVVRRCSFVSMDTEFTGVVFHNSKAARLPPEDYYKVMKTNVDALKIIQVGLTFCDSKGNLPDLGSDYCYTWQFNFRDFNHERDYQNPVSIDFLRQKGIDFYRHRYAGIDSSDFTTQMFTIELLGNKSITWVTFQSGYDFGYLVKILSRKCLPLRLDDFLKNIQNLFGDRVYDMKYLMRFCDNLYGGLDHIAEALEVDREQARSHQAGLGSLLIWRVFEKMCEVYFPTTGPAKHAGVV